MHKRFFIGASLKAMRGIQNIFEPRGYEVFAQFRYDGRVNVVVVDPMNQPRFNTFREM